MIPCLILTLLLTIALPHFSKGGSIDADFAGNFLQSFKTPCWLCDVPKCTECLASQWTQWSSCSSPCGKKGYQSRTRLVHRPPSCPNGSCGHVLSKEWRPCNRFCYNGGTPNRWFCSCPLSYIGDCCETEFLGWSSWGDWSQCSKSCSSGVQERIRMCIGSIQSNASVCGGACIGPNVETRACNSKDCPVQYESLGCFKDSTPRSLPLLIKNLRKHIDWNDMNKTVSACADLVQRRGLAIFGIQFYGECWSGVDAWKTYDIYGPSKNCWNGVGMEGSYFVYKFTK